jgi:hypothetical protein
MFVSAGYQKPGAIPTKKKQPDNRTMFLPKRPSPPLASVGTARG